MRLYNARSQKLQRFRPRPGKPVTVYVCGITPYDTTHLGHAFTYVTFDVLIRHMEVVHGWRVDYVQNLTDVDDDILEKAEAVGDDWRSLGTTWTERFVHDMQRLNLRPPDRFPAATGYIGAMHRMIEALMAEGRAYTAGGNVYLNWQDGNPARGFDDSSPDELLAIANERGNRPDDPHKRDPMDPVLWQATQPGEPTWSSPWGPGRPGWHIECSAMATDLLGPTVDIHGGGADLAFPHHAAETAIAEPASDPFVRVWMHVAMVEKDGEKMSKSLGNLVLIDDLLAEEHPDTLRLLLLRHHYRSRWGWDPEELSETRAWTRTLHGAMARESGRRTTLDPAAFGPRFTAAMGEDLDTPSALDVVMALADAILEAPIAADVGAAQDVLRATAGRVLGLWLAPEKEIGDRLPEWPAPEISAPDASPERGGP